MHTKTQTIHRLKINIKISLFWLPHPEATARVYCPLVVGGKLKSSKRKFCPIKFVSLVQTWRKRRSELSLLMKLWFAVAGRWSGPGVELLRVFSCWCSWWHCRWFPERWLLSPRHFGLEPSHFPGGLWVCWSDQDSGSGRHSRENQPPPGGAGAWAPLRESLVAQGLCSRRQTCLVGRTTRSRCGSLCECCAVHGTHPTSNHWALKVDQLLLWLEACRSHWYKKHQLLAYTV